jgi:hypothetical protein
MLEQTTLSLIGLCTLAFLILHFRLTNSWNRDAFRWGIPLFSFNEPFPAPVPAELIRKRVEFEGVAFEFMSENVALFKLIPSPSHLLMHRGSGYSIMLGEIVLDGSGTAYATLRIPYSVFFLFASILAAIFASTVFSNLLLLPSASQLLSVMTMVVIFWMFILFMQKEYFLKALLEIREYVREDT